MEPGFWRGDILFLHLGHAPVRTGEVVVYQNETPIPIVHRVIQIHEKKEKLGTEPQDVDILTKVWGALAFAYWMIVATAGVYGGPVACVVA